MKTRLIIIFCFLFLSIKANSQNDVFEIARKGSVEDLQLVLKNNPEAINNINASGFTALTIACYHGNEEVVAFLVNHVNNVNVTSNYGTPLMAAVVKDYLNIIKLLLSKEADTNIADQNGSTALHYATIFNQVETVKLLVNAGAKTTLKDKSGQSALDYAMIKNNTQLITLLKNN